MARYHTSAEQPEDSDAKETRRGFARLLTEGGLDPTALLRAQPNEVSDARPLGRQADGHGRRGAARQLLREEQRRVRAGVDGGDGGAGLRPVEGDDTEFL